MMKVIFFGLGSIGRQHVKAMQDNFRHKIFAFRSRKDGEPAPSGIKELYSWQEIRAIRPDVAFITNPTFLHIDTALKCADLRMHLFIEKPLSNSMAGILRLEKICRNNKLTCYTAYCLRFHPVIKKMRCLLKNKTIYHVRVACSSYLPLWRKDNDSKKYYSAYKNRGGGALLDLSHEFDYITYLFGKISRINGIFSRVSNVTIDAEDSADLFIKSENAPAVNLHLDFFSRINERSIKVDFQDGYLTGDLISNKIDFCYKGRRRHFSFAATRQEILRDQLCYFFRNLGNFKVMNGIQESKGLLVKILEFKNA